MENTIDYINENSWNDFSLDTILIDYSDIWVRILTPKESQLKIKCCNFVGIDYLGQWDENIIRDIHISKDSHLIDNVLNKINQNNDTNHKGGGSRLYTGNWYDVCIELIDELHIHIICQNIGLESC